MVSAAHAEDFSSANVSFTVVDIEHTSSGIITITVQEEVVLLTRDIYCKFLSVYTSYPYHLSLQQSAELLYAVRCFSAEKAAREYINRAEYSVFQLEQKLLKKGFSTQEIRSALAYLSSLALVDDTRFAEAWLHTRAMRKTEGKKRLFLELRKRGVSASIAEYVLAEFFTVRNEFALCEEMCQKYIQKGYSKEKLMRALQRKGFPGLTIKKALAAVQLSA